jgi:nucleotide-binding universal stress UspA family protein
MKILLCTDGSTNAERAAAHVAALHRELHPLDLTMLYVDIPLTGKISTLLEPDAVEQMHRANADAAFKSARVLLRRAKVHSEEVIRSGKAVDCITQTALRGKFDLIVIGSRGRSPLVDWILGSTTAEVLATSKVPVLVVP